MTLRVLTKYVVMWMLWHLPPTLTDDPEALRILTRKCLHVGLRPHSDAPGDVAATLQVTFCSPF